MKQTDPAQRDFRRRNIYRRWPRFRWDAFGRPRLQIWTNSLLAMGLGLVAMLASILLELYWLKAVPETTHVTPDLLLTPKGSAAVIAIVLAGAWLADRHFESVTARGARPSRWFRALRFLILMVPLIGILVRLAWYRFLQQNPRIRRETPSRPPLALESSRYFRFHPLRRLDHLLRAAFQHLWVVFLWMTVFQFIPFFAALESLGLDARHNSFSHTVVGLLCIFFRIVAFGAFLIFAKERHREVQLKSRETLTAGISLIATLLPFPWSFAALLIFLPLLGRAKLLTDESTALATIYKKSFGSRTLREVTPTPLVSEIRGNAELQRGRFCVLKVLLLALEVTSLAWILAPRIGVASFSSSFWIWAITISFCAAAPGILIWILKFSSHVRTRGRAPAMQPALPDCTFLILVPCVAAQAFVVGSLAGLGARSILATLFLTMSNEGIALTVLVGSFRAMTALLTRAPDPLFTGAALGITASCLFLVVGGLLGNPRIGPHILPTGRSLCMPILFASPLVGLVFGHWLLRPFGFCHLFDRHISGHVRAMLAAYALPAVLPLGGLAVPVWVRARNRTGRTWNRDLMQVMEVRHDHIDEAG